MGSNVNRLPLRPADVAACSRWFERAHSDWLHQFRRASALLEVFYAMRSTDARSLLQMKAEIGYAPLIEALKKVEPAAANASVEELAGKHVENQLLMAQGAAECGAIMLAHAGFEAVVIAGVRACAVLDRTKMIERLIGSMDPIKAREAVRDLHGALDNRLEARIAKADENLCGRVELFCAISGEGDALFEGGQYTMKELAAFDRARHDAVHEDGALVTGIDLTVHLGGLAQMAIRMGVILKKRYGLVFDPVSFYVSQKPAIARQVAPPNAQVTDH